MSKTLEGMARAYWVEAGLEPCEFTVDVDDTSRLRAALLWLADNVSDEMVFAYLTCKPTNPRNLHNAIRQSIAAALRAAAGGGDK